MSITKRIANKLTDYNNRESTGSRLRAKRLEPLTELIQRVFDNEGQVNIIDIGGARQYWNNLPATLLRQCNVTITVVNLSLPPITDNNEHFNYVRADACNLSQFDNGQFHIAHSNSVVEHVGDWQKMVLFAQELKRVAEFYFVQTPNYWFPVEPHCMTPLFHWLPKPMRLWLVMHFSLGNWTKCSSVDSAMRTIESSRLLNKTMFLSLFDDSEVIIERVLFLPKSFIGIKR